MTNNARLLIGSVLAAGLLAGPGLAAAENKSDLDSQPAVRHRLLLVVPQGAPGCRLHRPAGGRRQPVHIVQ